ncbi:MAG: UvrB/UvrC motif-containing protein [Opitutus sp.]|nr:UvrB/UvrC motif-containing protein [Opitutus sp.]MCS6248201.1 UvrB/UvrC motif-containing protein [Opitutus sp.]MCS6274789.1 UvrB/UvrC motif-containing protein [Opitutus sp.]MCS6278216.1 UvrB/UvrC motif-containing protein [Opitutus sp.]MCS6299326.1 UvrB/UvrC motif-containing protein [Opitutus sp.]
MASPLKCDLCSNPATVHLTQIVNNKVHKVDLCEACAQAKGVTDPSGFSLADLLLKASLNPEAPTAGVKCEQCGFTQNDFKKLGRFGCPQCYSTFSSLVDPMLDNMHKGTAHAGKVPEHALERKSIHERITELEVSLDKAVRSELYEDAARFRDEINQLKQAFEHPKSAL